MIKEVLQVIIILPIIFIIGLLSMGFIYLMVLPCCHGGLTLLNLILKSDLEKEQREEAEILVDCIRDIIKDIKNGK